MIIKLNKLKMTDKNNKNKLCFKSQAEYFLKILFLPLFIFFNYYKSMKQHMCLCFRLNLKLHKLLSNYQLLNRRTKFIYWGTRKINIFFSSIKNKFSSIGYICMYLCTLNCIWRCYMVVFRWLLSKSHIYAIKAVCLFLNTTEVIHTLYI